MEFGEMGHLLTQEEKCKAHGIFPSSLVSLDDRDHELAVGSTIPVSLVGVVLCPILKAWIEHRRRLPEGHT